MDKGMPVAVAGLIAAAERVVALAGGMENRALAHATNGACWSRRLRTSEAAAILGISESALRRRIRAHICPAGTAVFDGICAEKLGARYLVRLSRRWLSDPQSCGGPAATDGDLPA